MKYSPFATSENEELMTEEQIIESRYGFHLPHKYIYLTMAQLRKIYSNNSVQLVWDEILLEFQRKLNEPKVEFMSLFSKIYRKRLFLGMGLNILRE